jgi:protein O-GlcNAc transferase
MKPSVDQDLRKAVSLSTRGMAAEAEAIYRAILTRFPNNKRALDGIKALATPKASEPPAQEVQWLLSLYHQGRLPELVARLESLIAFHPGSVFLHNMAGAAFAGMGRFAEAVDHYDKALAIHPAFADGWSNRGVALQALRRLEEAVASFDTAIRIEPDAAHVWSNKSNALKPLGRRDEALSCCDRAIRIDPAYAEAWSNKGLLLLELKQPQAALDCCDAAIRLKPGFAEAHNNRGLTLRDLGQLAAALDSIETAIGLNPAFAAAHGNHGVALRELGRTDDALTSFDAAIRLAPDHPDAYYNRGNALQDARRLDEALDSFEAALKAGSDDPEVPNQILYLQARMCAWAGAYPAVDPGILGIETKAVTPFTMLIFDDDGARHLQRARAFSRQRYPSVDVAEPIAPVAKARIRIGYFSADFHDHATMYLLAKLFEAHDKARFEIHAFSYGADRQDAMRRRLVNAVDAFHDVRHLDDKGVADLARAQAIDIAIDLKGHTQHTRSGIFAWRAAPIQINYLGYPGSMGADFIDYIVADKVVIPDGQRGLFSEKVIALPGCYQPNDDERVIAGETPGRTALGLPEQGFVFCSFNNNYKISPIEFGIWMRLLAKVDGSVLWLLRDNVWAEANLRREAAGRGVDPARLIFADRAPLADHLARHRHADLFLDTFTVNAHTTASDALWVGLPVITKIGSSFASRVASSLLHAVGMADLVTATPEGYEQLALDLALHSQKLAAVKTRLVANRLTTPLFQTDPYARHLERAYKLAFDRYVQGLAADHIDVPTI